MTSSPFFEAPRDPSPDRRRLLLISHHFPPLATAGALRWQKLATHAARHGWVLDVVMVAPDTVGRVDEGRLDDLPAGTRLFGVRGGRVWVEQVESALASMARRIRRPRRTRTSGESSGSARPVPSVVRPDSILPEDTHWIPRSPREAMRAYWAWLDFARAGIWARRAYEVARDVVEPGVHQAIVTCGPPHMAHEAGRRLARTTGLPLVMDLRDPWAIRRRMVESVAHPLWFRIAGRHERRALDAASLVVANTDPVARRMRQDHPDHAERILTVTNGYDDDALPASDAGTCFTATYAGGIYLDRDPRPFFRSAGRVVKELGLTPERFRVQLVGQVSEYGGVPVQELAERAGIGGMVDVRPPVPRGELFDILARAAMLVSLPQDSPWAIPSKIFEYMQFDAWMLVLAEDGSPVASLLEGSTADVVAPENEDGIAGALRERIQAFERGERPVKVGSDERFSRRYQADRLFSALEDVVGAPSGTVASHEGGGTP